jgi:hypothetical protein
LRLDTRFRAAFYAGLTVLFGTGAAWFAVDRLKESGAGAEGPAVGPYLLMAHGGTAMLFLLMLGALIPLHTRTAWRARMNRASGIVMLSCGAVLILTAFGLYYVGSEWLRQWTSNLHIVLGLGFPLLLAVHATLGRRRLRAAQMADARHGLRGPRSREYVAVKRRVHPPADEPRK